MTVPSRDDRWPQSEVPSPLRSAVRDYASQGPDAAHLEQMLQNVNAQVGGAAGAHASTAATRSLLSLKKLWLGLGAMAVGAVIGVQQLAPAEPAVQALPAAPTVVQQPAPTPAPAPIAVPDQQPPAHPAEPQAAPPEPSVDPAAVSPEVHAAPRPARRRRARPRRRPTPAAAAVSEPTASVPAGDPLAELALLRRARSALARDPARALSLTDEHRSQFTQGTFTQEREMLAIESLLGLGRRAEAERRASAFRSRFPESTHARRLGTLLGKPQ